MPDAATPEEALAAPYDTGDEQRDAATLGMWIFLATEVLFFGGMLAGYTVYRTKYPTGFAHAAAQTEIVLGTINTVLLLCSSFAMALAVHAAEASRRRMAVLLLVATMALGLAFLGIKGWEWWEDARKGLVPGAHFAFAGPEPRAAQLFFLLYFAMTGVHALHMIGGLGLVGWRIRSLARLPVGTIPEREQTRTDIVGLYWHFVDIVWIFLFPLLYLAGRA